MSREFSKTAVVKQCRRHLIRTIARSPIHEWIRDTKWITAFAVPYLDNERGYHELQGWSRLRDFFRTYLPKRVERESSPTPKYRTRARFGMLKDTFVFVETFSPAIYVFTFLLSFFLSFFAPSLLYHLLDYNRTCANIDKAYLWRFYLRY